MSTGGGEGETQPVLVPPATFDGSKVAYVAACSQSAYSNKHSLILGSDKRVWACGLAHHCALGMVDTVNLLEPTLLPDVAMFAQPGTLWGCSHWALGWHACSWLLTHEQQSLAFIMGLHSRLGVGCAHSIMPLELVQRLLK